MRQPFHLSLHWIPPLDSIPTPGIAEVALSASSSSICTEDEAKGVVVLGGSCRCIEELDQLTNEIRQDLDIIRQAAIERFRAK